MVIYKIYKFFGQLHNCKFWGDLENVAIFFENQDTIIKRKS